MNKYANPEMIAEALAAGQSAESIAEAMTKALNDAIAEQKAKDEKAKQKARIKDAEDIAVNAMVTYIRVMFEVEGLAHLVSEKDWESLRADMAKGWMTSMKC